MAAAIVRGPSLAGRERDAQRSQRSSHEGNKSSPSRKPPEQRDRPTEWWRVLGVALLAGALVLAVFWPASRGGFVWDDGGLITNRHDTLDEWADIPAAFGRAATAGEGVAYYRPLMISTFVVDARLFGFDAPAFHRTNIVMHAVNVALMVLLLVAYGCALVPAAMAGLLFGLHPLQCQAVALIFGRNDLMLVPPVVAMLVADEVVRRRGRPRLADVLVTLAFAVTLWTKETGIVAPIFLVLLDLLWRGKSWRDLRARIPLGIACAVVTLLYLATRIAVIGAALDTGTYGYVPPLERPALATAILGYYVRHAFLPWGAAPAPYHAGLVDPARPDLWIAAGVVATFAVATAFALRRNPRLACGLLMFATGLLPVLAIVAQMKVLILDHRTYLPLLGLAFGAAAWRSLERDVASRVASVLVLVGLAVLTSRRLPSYHDSVSLWALGVEAAPSSDYARNNYGAALMDADRFPEAVAQLREALRLNPEYDKARFNLAGCLDYLGDRAGALREMQVLVERRPRDVGVLSRLAGMQSRAGDFAGAQAAWEKAVAVKPDDPGFVRNLADVLERRGSVAAALPLRRRLTELQPNDTGHWASLGRVLAGTGQSAEAVGAFQRAISLDPANGAAHIQLAQTLWQIGRWNEAAVEASRARALGLVDPGLMQRLAEAGVAVP